jgi:hypothetical protein
MKVQDESHKGEWQEEKKASLWKRILKLIWGDVSLCRSGGGASTGNSYVAVVVGQHFKGQHKRSSFTIFYHLILEGGYSRCSRWNPSIRIMHGARHAYLSRWNLQQI